MEPWHSAITTSDKTHVWVRGHDLNNLMEQASFADVVFLLQRGTMPTPAARRMLNAILIGTADHGPASLSSATARMVASGNRQSLEAAMAAGILAIGDAHGGAGMAMMEMIEQGMDLARRDNLSITEAADRIVRDRLAAGKRIPGLGHVSHSEDPRATTLFRMAYESGLARDGVQFAMAVAESVRAQVRPLPINVDGAIGAVLYDLGFPPPFGKAIFIIGRTAGLAAQVLEEYTREKPRRIRIPVVYDGPPVEPPMPAECA